MKTSQEPIRIAEPFLGGRELELVSDCIKTSWISSQGSYVEQLQNEFSKFIGSAFGLTTSNGTTALHLAMAALGVAPGDEVIIPNLTFGASANAVLHCGAKPVLVDVCRSKWTMQVKDVEAKVTAKTKAIMPVHIYGQPAPMPELMEFAKSKKLFVIEDCAESIGAKIDGKLTGAFGDVGCFSFFANKVMTTGEGGMVLTDNEELFKKLEVLRDHGMDKNNRYWHLYPGFNYRLTNLQAAIGVAQMEQLPHFMEKRIEIKKAYEEVLGQVPGIQFAETEKGAEPVNWLFSVLIDKKEFGLSADQVMAALKEEAIDSRKFFHPLHRQPPYGDKSASDADFPNTVHLTENGLCLPTHVGLSMDQVQRVAETIAALRDL